MSASLIGASDYVREEIALGIGSADPFVAARYSSRILPVGSWCLIAPSGRYGSPDNPLEPLLLSACATALATRGFSSIVVDMPLPATGAANTALREQRLARVVEAYRWMSSVAQPHTGIACLGYSLGAQHLLSAAAIPTHVRPPDALVLVGCVAETPTYLPTAIRTVHLIYGESDGVVYTGDNGEDSRVFGPVEYGAWSAANILPQAGQRCLVSIWQSCGHLLIDRMGSNVGEVSAELAEAVHDALQTDGRNIRD